MKNRPTFSLCMILRNEEANLDRSLGPVAESFDEVVVVDTGSSDRTPEMARSYGARVIEIEWPDDFAAARNVSIRAATGDWIMWLDGDNHVSPEGVRELRLSLEPGREAILWCTEVVVPDGERLIQKRVFPRRPEVYFEGRVHEQLVHPADYRSVLTPVEIEHWGYADKAQARDKGRRNLRLLEEMAAGQPDDLYICYQMGRTLLNLRRFDEAASWLGRAAAVSNGRGLNPALYLHAHILLAQALDRLGRQAESEQVLRGLVRAEPDYGPGHFELGRRRYLTGDFGEAAARFQSFLDLGAGDLITGLNPVRTRTTAAVLLGRCLEKTGDQAGAARAFKNAVRNDPRGIEARLALARLSWQEGKPEEARNHLARCLELSPGNRRAVELWREVAGHA